jgi:hypothetical protein
MENFHGNLSFHERRVRDWLEAKPEVKLFWRGKEIRGRLDKKETKNEAVLQETTGRAVCVIITLLFC